MRQGSNFASSCRRYASRLPSPSIFTLPSVQGETAGRNHIAAQRGDSRQSLTGGPVGPGPSQRNLADQTTRATRQPLSDSGSLTGSGRFLIETLHDLDQRPVNIVSLTPPMIDTTTPMGRALYGIAAVRWVGLDFELTLKLIGAR